MKRLVAALTLFLISPAAALTQDADEAAIRGVLAAQAEAWNSGDIPGFMAGYWNSPDLRFASGGSIEALSNGIDELKWRSMQMPCERNVGREICQ